jgi:hypothetical protein
MFLALVPVALTSSSSSSLSASAQLFPTVVGFDFGAAETSVLSAALAQGAGFATAGCVETVVAASSDGAGKGEFCLTSEFDPHTPELPTGTSAIETSFPLFSRFKEDVFNGVGAAAAPTVFPIDFFAP